MVSQFAVAAVLPSISICRTHIAPEAPTGIKSSAAHQRDYSAQLLESLEALAGTMHVCVPQLWLDGSLSEVMQTSEPSSHSQPVSGYRMH